MCPTLFQLKSDIVFTFATPSSMSSLFFTSPLKLLCSFHSLFPFPFFTDLGPLRFLQHVILLDAFFVVIARSHLQNNLIRTISITDFQLPPSVPSLNCSQTRFQKQPNSVFCPPPKFTVNSSLRSRTNSLASSNSHLLQLILPQRSMNRFVPQTRHP